jgi:hypothetical protein
LFCARLYCTPKVRFAASEHLSTGSTNLDNWQIMQLHITKAGGNDFATNFFTWRRIVTY